MKWTIQRVDGFSKCLKDLSAVALKNFDRKILDLEKSEDPTVSAEFVPQKSMEDVGRSGLRGHIA